MNAPTRQPAPGFDRELGQHTPEAIVRWTLATLGDDIILTSSFGAESAVMLHLVSRIIPSIRVVFIDTGYLFPETYRFAEELRRRLDLDVRVYTPEWTSARLEALHGPLWQGDEDALARYQQLTKVEPMRRALEELKPKAWLAGLRRVQTNHRANLAYVQQQGQHTKVCPILDFTDDDVRSYLKQHDLPYHPLYEQGYRSIGDVHSTRPTLPAERDAGARRSVAAHGPGPRLRALKAERAAMAWRGRAALANPSHGVRWELVPGVTSWYE